MKEVYIIYVNDQQVYISDDFESSQKKFFEWIEAAKYNDDIINVEWFKEFKEFCGVFSKRRPRERKEEMKDGNKDL